MTEEKLRGSEASAYSDSIYEVVFTPVMERAEYQTEPLRSKLVMLREKMSEEDFEQYINKLLRITYNGRQLWLITRSERHRTLLEGRYGRLLREVFEVAVLRVFSQP